MVHYKLTYFGVRGAAETARQIFALAGKEFEDIRIEKDQWPSIKSKMPFGQLPVLEVDGKQLAQSHAICRYLAREFGVNGKNAWEEAQVNAIADQSKDYLNEVRPYFMVMIGFAEGDAEKLKKEVLIPAVKKNFAYFTNILKTNGSGYLVGSSPTWIDLFLAQHVSDLLKNNADVLEEFGEIKEHQKRIHGIASIKKWIETRPETPF